MRLSLLAFILAGFVMLLSSSSAFADPALSIDKASGSISDTFVFTGSGFDPGTVLKGKYTTPSGKEYGFSAGYGEQSFVVGSDGTWTLSFSPAQSPYNDGAPGAWSFKFCLASDASVCWSSSFTVG